MSFRPQIPKDKPGEQEPAFKRSLRIVKFNETVDGNIWIDKATKRIKPYIESRGHIKETMLMGKSIEIAIFDTRRTENAEEFQVKLKNIFRGEAF